MNNKHIIVIGDPLSHMTCTQIMQIHIKALTHNGRKSLTTHKGVSVTSNTLGQVHK